MTQEQIIEIMLRGVQEAEAKHPNWPTKNIVKCAAIVAEETGELVQAALQYEDEGGAAVCIQKEAVHTLVTAFRLLKNFEITAP